MPIYEYGCSKCGHEFEAEQRITDAPLKTCPECRSRKVRRLISRTSFVLKGGGWYSDLYSSPGGAKADAPAGEASSEKGSEKGPEKGADKKSEKKTDSGSGGSESAPKAGSGGSTKKGPKAAA